jgi:hypothetical protein
MIKPQITFLKIEPTSTIKMYSFYQARISAALALKPFRLAQAKLVSREDRFHSCRCHLASNQKYSDWTSGQILRAIVQRSQ